MNKIFTNYLSNDENNDDFSLLNLDDCSSEKNTEILDLDNISNSFIESIIKPIIEKTIIEKTIFKINSMPFLEKKINKIIKKMNINEETKIFLFLDADDNNEEIRNLRNELFFKDCLRMKKQQKNRKLTFFPKRGRKTKNINSNRIHNKYSPDNIIKSIKTKLNDSLLFFLNKLINSIYNAEEINQILLDLKIPLITKDSDKNKILKKNDYKTRLKKSSKSYNLKFLSLTINEYISENISSKFNNFPKENNKLIIHKLFEDIKNKDIFYFIFNYLKIEDWLNIFIYKNEIDNFINSKELNDNKINIIKDSLIRIDDDFIDMKKDDKIYFHCFALMIYNLRRYFIMKEGRTTKDNKID